MDVLLTNGATTLRFLPGMWQMPRIPAWAKPQRILTNTSPFDRVHTISQNYTPRDIVAHVSLYGPDKGVYTGADSLMGFFSAADPSGVDGMAQTFLLRDADGALYQVRFAERPALETVVKEWDFRGDIALRQEYVLPTEDSAGLLGWFAAYDMDANGGDLSAWTTSDEVGNTGTEWDDLSANAYDAVQATQTNRPLWKTSQINSRPAVDFDGTDNFLNANAIATVFSGASDHVWSAYAVVQPDSAGGVQCLFSVGSASLSDRIEFFQRNANTAWRQVIYDGATTKTVSGSSTITAGNIYILSFVSTGTALSMHVNGASVLSAGDMDVGSIDTQNRAVIGATMVAGSTSQWFDGRIGEAMLYSIEHSAVQRRRQELRLADMWGVALAA